MRVFRPGLVALCLGVALLDTSAVVDAAPADGAPASRVAAPAPSVLPAAFLKRPAAAAARVPSQIAVVESEGPSAMAARAVKRIPKIDISCKPEALKLVWPLEGTAGTTWVINNYTDLDPSLAKKDWKGASGDAAATYDGHRGYDIDVGSFREMDGDKVLARAAAPGKVTEVDQDNADRNVTCASTPWNYVAIEHANGFVSYYGHLKRYSAKVQVGQAVKVGDVLGTVGSSGCSTAPHLHFEVHDCDNKWFDAAKVPGMWNVSPSQREVSGILDIMLRVGGIPDVNAIKSPGPNPTHVPKGKLGIGLSAALKAGDELTFLVLNSTFPEVWSWKASGRYGHSMPSWSVSLSPGPAHILVWLNDELKIQRTLTVQ